MHSEDLHMEYYITAFVDQTLTAEEEQLLHAWLAENTEHQALFEEMLALYTVAKEIESPISAVQSYENFSQKLPKQNKSHLKGYRNWSIAAAIALLIGSVVYFALHQTSTVHYVSTSIVDSTLLDDGTRIFAKNAVNVDIASNFSTSSTRQMKQLSGELFYEIKHDASHPFIIENTFGNVMVVGTAFVIQATDSSTSIIVTEGKVKVYRDRDTVLLVANDKLVLRRNSIMQKQENRDPNFLFWKTQILSYDNKSLRDVLDDIESKFGYTIHMNSTLNMKQLNGKYFAHHIEDVIQTICTTFDLSYQMNEKEITLTQK